MQSPRVVKDGSLEVVGNVRLVRKNSIRSVILMIVDVQLNIGKT